MTVALTTPITGQAQTGFTSPTYTITADLAPSALGKQYAVTGLGGTQAGVTTHSVSSPFTLTFFRPPTFKTVGKPNPVTGLIRDFPVNSWKFVARKGVTVQSGQPIQIAEASLSMKIPAGADLNDAPNVRALLSALFGAAVQASAGIGDSLVQGTV